MELLQVWYAAIDAVIKTMKTNEDQAILELIKTQIFVRLENNKILFICNNQGIYSLMPKYFSSIFLEMSQLLGRNDLGVELQLAASYNNATNNNQFGTAPVQPQSPMQAAPQVSTDTNSYYQPAPVANSAPVQSPSLIRDDNINPEKTFENYVTDPENQLVYAIAQRIATDPGSEAHNPFYVYGGSGLGKTHLLWAIANRIRQTKPHISVIYIRAEEFIRKYVESMSKKNFDPLQVQFQDMFTKHDVFIMDDIQSLTKGEKARDTFFEIIADFLDKPGRQLILASDVAPGILKNFNPRLVSRFGSGVCREIYPPSAETRSAITLAKCRELKINLPIEVVDYISKNIRSSVREIEGAIKTLKSHIDLKGEMITYDEAVKSLSNLVNVSRQVTNIDAIKERVAKEYGVTVTSMESAERKKATSLARSMAMKLANDLIPTLSLNDIGRAFNKDHSSVHEAIKRTCERIETNSEQSSIYQKLSLSLKKD